MNLQEVVDNWNKISKYLEDELSLDMSTIYSLHNKALADDELLSVDDFRSAHLLASERVESLGVALDDLMSKHKVKVGKLEVETIIPTDGTTFKESRIDS